MDRRIIAFTVGALALSGLATAAMAVPACTPDEVRLLPQSYGLEAIDPAPGPVIAYPFGSRKAYGFDVSYVVDAEGRVTCAAITDETRPSKGPDDADTTEAPPEITPQRQAALDRLVATRFRPYLADGKPAAVYLNDFIAEEQLPKYHVAPPKGDLKAAHIRQEWHADMVPGTESYELDIYGDGRVVYQPLDDDLIGEQTYSIPPAEVQALLDTAADVDFWSYDDEAMASPIYLIHSASLGTEITYGGRSNRLGFASDLFGGEPDRLSLLQKAIRRAGRIDWWNTLPREALDHLQANGFDFKGQKGSDLLGWALDHDLSEDSVQRILQLGAPVLWSKPGRDGRVSSPLTAALEGKRLDLARSMIANGALLIDGKPDRARVNSAFIATLGGGLMDGVELMLPYDPDLVGPGIMNAKYRMSVIFWLAGGGEKPDAGAIAEWLIAHGAPVDAREERKQSILSFASEVGQIEVVKVLLKHGASPDAIDEDDSPPLGKTWEEDVALVLLEGGADPAKLESSWSESFYGHVHHDHWTRVRAWLEAHGHGDRLKAYEEATQ